MIMLPGMQKRVVAQLSNWWRYGLGPLCGLARLRVELASGVVLPAEGGAPLLLQILKLAERIIKYGLEVPAFRLVLSR